MLLLLLLSLLLLFLFYLREVSRAEQGEQARGARREAAEADIIIKSGRQIVRPLRNKFDSALERERASVRARVCVSCVLTVFLC